ncbi:Agglutinin-like protein 1, partial [Candida tropicalis]
MPCVFKFTTSATTINLRANGITYATCDLHAGEEFTTFSSLDCTITEPLVSVREVSGKISIPLAFNVGGSGSSVDIVGSTCFTLGTNTITFQDGDTSFSTQARFEAPSGPSSGLLYLQRAIPSLNKVNGLAILPDCPNGYTSGTLGFSSNQPGYSIDCSGAEGYLSELLNPWQYPTTAEPFSYYKTCTSNSFEITFNNIPAGFRPYIAALVLAPQANYNVHYTAKYRCVGAAQRDASSDVMWTGYNNANPDSFGGVVVVTTVTGTQSKTIVRTVPFDPNVDQTKIIEVVHPIPTVTTTTSYVGVSTSYSTITAPIGGTATIIVDEPYHITTTVTSPWTGTFTTSTTVIAATDSVDTIIIQEPTPNPTVTTTQFGAVIEPSTITYTNPLG